MNVNIVYDKDDPADCLGYWCFHRFHCLQGTAISVIMQKIALLLILHKMLLRMKARKFNSDFMAYCLP